MIPPADGGYPRRDGNRVRPLIGGREAFQRIAEAVDSARKRVWLTVAFYADDFRLPDGRGLFDLLDSNRDGRLSIREMRQAAKLLDVLEKDADGQLSKSKLPRFLQLSVSEGGVGNTQLPPRFANMARVLRPPQPPPPRPTAGPAWFRKMDRNGDGDVTLKEFLGREMDFHRFDTNGDGLLDATEAKAAGM